MNTFKVSELEENTYFSQNLVLDKTFLLLTPSVSLSADLINALKDWNFEEVYSEGSNKKSIEDKFEQINSDIKINPVIVTSENTTTEFESSEASRLAAVKNVYDDYISYISNLYTRYSTHKELKIDQISATIKEFCIFVKENRRYVLRIQPANDNTNKTSFVNHAMRSTVLAITIGLQLRLPLTKLIELGVACLLHEIGMLRLSPTLYYSDRKLTPLEKNTINTHPIISYNILKDYDFPLSICLGVLEHHEKENGLGYPRRLSKDKISMYAKIISVACSFEAITAPRKYKEEQTTHMAMVEMLKNTGKQYDETVIKALLFSLSLFPIGAYVYLTNGKLGQVTDVNPENPKHPIVQLIGEKDLNGEPISIQTSDSGTRILRVLDKKEAAETIQQLNQEIPL